MEAGKVITQGIMQAFNAISEVNEATRYGMQRVKKQLIASPGDFSSENQRPTTCLSNIYKWFTSCLQIPLDIHLNTHDLMEGEQRGAKAECSGIAYNLIIDKMVTQDCHRSKRIMSMAWVYVKKAYGSVDQAWLTKMMVVH